MKYEPSTGMVEYYSQIHYKPIFRFNSVNAEISDNSARSFPVMIDISYLIQLPMWMFDSLDEKNIIRINLGLIASDNISSIIADNQFLAVGDEPFKINDITYKIGHRYIIDPTSPNFHDNRIVLPRPKGDFTIQLAKLFPRNSSVVSWANSHRSLPHEITKENLRFWLGSKDLKTKIVNNDDFYYEKNTITGEEEVHFITQGNPDITPDLDSPIIISFLFPVSEKEEKKMKSIKRVFNKVYEVRDQKCWRRI